MRGPLPNDIRLLQPTLARRFALLAASQMITISLRSPSATFARASSSCAICTLSFMLQMQSGTRMEWSSSSLAAFRIVIQGKWSSFFLSAAAIMVTAQCLVGSVSNILIMGITTATLLAKGYRGVLCGVSGGSSALPKLNSRKYKEELEEKGMSTIQVQELLDLLEKRISGHSSSELALEYADYLLESGKLTEALASLESFCMKKKPKDASSWIQWAGLSSSPRIILSRATEFVPMSSSSEHLKVLLQLFGYQLTKEEENSVLFETFQRLLLLSPSTQEIFIEDLCACQSFGLRSIAEACVKYLEHAATIGISAVRKVYSAVLFNTSIEVNNVNMELLCKFVEMSANIESKDKARRRRIYDRALELFEGTDLEFAMSKLRENNATTSY